MQLEQMSQEKNVIRINAIITSVIENGIWTNDIRANVIVANAEREM
jgi:hypothetical protein